MAPPVPSHLILRRLFRLLYDEDFDRTSLSPSTLPARAPRERRQIEGPGILGFPEAYSSP